MRACGRRPTGPHREPQDPSSPSFGPLGVLPTSSSPGALCESCSTTDENAHFYLFVTNFAGRVSIWWTQLCQRPLSLQRVGKCARPPPYLPDTGALRRKAPTAARGAGARGAGRRELIGGDERGPPPSPAPRCWSPAQAMAR